MSAQIYLSSALADRLVISLEDYYYRKYERVIRGIKISLGKRLKAITKDFPGEKLSADIRFDIRLIREKEGEDK